MGNFLKNDLQKNDINYNTTARKEIIIATGGNEKINDDNSIDSKPNKYLAFGDNDYGIISYLKEFPIFKQLFIGNFQAFGFSDKDNKYYSFGLNSYGQLGQGTPTNYIRKNSSVKYNFYETFGSMWELTYINFNQVKTRVKFTLMSFGDGFSVAADTQNNIYTWGRGEEHQLGFELNYKDSDLVQNVKCRLKPTLVFNSSYDIIDLQCGKDFTFMHNSNKQVYAWGNNNDQQIMPFKHQNKLDTGKRYCYKKVENIIIEDYEFKSIKCGWSHTVALTYANKAFIWGKIEENDSFDDIYRIISDKQTEFTEISSGFSHVILKSIDDKLYAFGDNRYVSLNIV